MLQSCDIHTVKEATPWLTHGIKTSILKMSKLQKAVTAYRAMEDDLLPEELQKKNDRGGAAQSSPHL